MSNPTVSHEQASTLIHEAIKEMENNAFDKAFSFLNKAKSLRQPFYGLDLKRGICFLEMKQPDAAREALREELRYFPHNTEAKRLLDEISLRYPQTIFGDIEDAEFRELLTAIRPYTMLGEKRLFSLFSLAKKICSENIPGNFVECGVAAGGSAALLAYVIKKYSKQPRLLHAFDSFKGMPQPTVYDQHQGHFADAMGWGAGTCGAPESCIATVCKQLGVFDIVRIIKGDFHDTLPKQHNTVGMIALLHLDSDWYESTREVLAHLYSQIVNDGILQVDDYEYWEGCKNALHEFERERKVTFKIQSIDNTGVWFYKPDTFKLNAALPQLLVHEFYQDDSVRVGIQSQMSLNERFQLYYTVRHLLRARYPVRRFIEIGSYAGASFLIMYRAFKRGSQQIQGFAIESKGHKSFYDIIERHKDNVMHLKMLSKDAVREIQPVFKKDGMYPEFIFIDGDHTYEGVRNDIEHYFPLLVQGGIIMLHDFLPPLNEENSEAILFHHAGNEPGIRRACQELLEEKFNCEVLDIPLLYPHDPTQSQSYLPLIPGVFSTMRAYRKR